MLALRRWVDRRLSLVFIVAVATVAVVASWAASSARADCSAGSTLLLAPPTQTHFVGETGTVVGTLTDGCGHPVQGATVTFDDVSGPDTDLTGTGLTDTNGQAVFSYSGLIVGTDEWDATVTNPAGTITSNTVNVIWVAPPVPTSKDQCKNGGWQSFRTTFKNQGDCVSFVATGGKNPAG